MQTSDAPQGEREELPPDPEVIGLLRAVGVYARVARRLAEQPWVSADLVRRWIAALQRRPNVRHVGAVLTSVLCDREAAPPAPAESQPAGFEPLPVAGPDPPDMENPEGEELAQHEPLLPPGAWEAALEHLRQRLGEKVVEVWLGGARPLAREGGVLVIAARSPTTVDWLKHRLYGQVSDAIEAACGKRYSLRFVVGGRR